MASYRALVIAYAVIGAALAVLFTRLSPAIQPRAASSAPHQSRFGLHRSQGIVIKLSALFALDAFAGGFVVSSFVAYWFNVRFGAEPGALGTIFFAANILAGISALLAARIARRFGLINTMVFTHGMQSGTGSNPLGLAAAWRSGQTFRGMFLPGVELRGQSIEAF